MSEHVIEARGITRYFGNLCAVDRLTMSVPRGSVFALLGRNGSGKSTLIRMLLGLMDATRGEASVLGEDCRRLSPGTRGRIGYVAEGHPLIDWMNASELEWFQKAFYPQWDGRMFKTILDHFELGPHTKAGQLSRGQRAGLSLALALATGPALLIMDDPAMGLDPVARRTLLEAMILITRDAGHTIFFSSHVLSDVERVADHVAILDRSVLRVSCSVETLLARVKRVTLHFAKEAPAAPDMPGLLASRREGSELRLTVANAGEEVEKIVASLGAISVSESAVSLEDAVIGYLGSRGETVSLFQRSQAAGAVS